MLENVDVDQFCTLILPTLDLTKDSYLFGRDDKADVSYLQSSFPRRSVFLKLSKKHFELFKVTKMACGNL